MKTIFYLFLALLFSHEAAAQSIFWTGATDTDWGTGSNWSTNVPPAAADNVFVPVGLARYPVLNGDASIKSLAVQSGSLLTINAGRTLTISGAGVGYSIDLYGRIENNGTIAVSATSDAVYLNGDAQLNNNTGATLSVTTTGNYGVRLSISGIFTNQTGATATITGNSGSLLFSGANAPTEMVKNYGKMTLTGQIEKYTDTFHNYPCGVVILTSGEVYNNGGQIINEGFFSAPATLNGLAENFVNDGIISVDNFAPSYTNNAIRIYNNADATSIFGFGTSNNLTVAGIYKDDAATLSAGDYNQATNTFTHFGLSAGSQTLYAKITRPGGTCPQIVPFTFVVSVASDFTTHPTHQTVCPGSPAVFTVTIASAASYQWQLNTGSGWTNLSASIPYSNVTTATLNISNATGLNGYQYRCVATGAGGVSIPSNAATLTISVGGGSSPTGIITWTGAVDTDWNTPCNWSPSSVPTATNDVVIPNTTNKPIISIAAVAQSVEVQAGAALTITATKSLTINGSKFIDSFTSGLFNAGTIHNNGQLILGNVSSVGEFGLLSTGTFNHNAGAEITIDRATIGGLLNYPGGIFTNAAKITLGANASVGFTGLSNFATFNNNSGGEIIINRSSNDGLYNFIGGTFTNAAKISIGTLTSYMAKGLTNFAAFFNNAGGEITIDNTDAYGILSTKYNPSSPTATFTNAGKITIGAIALRSIGLTNSDGSTFNNNTGGEITIDRSISNGLWNNLGGTFNNAAKITIGSTASAGTNGLKNEATFNNNTGGEIKIDNSTDRGLWNQGGTFTNAAAITIGAMASVGSIGLYNYAVFNNNTGGEIRVDNATGTGVENEGGTFNNTAKIIIGFTSSTGQYGIHNRDNGTFNNNSGSEITIDKSTIAGLLNIRTSTFTNAAKINIGATASVGTYGLANAFTSSFTNNPGGIITLDNSNLSGITAFAGSTLTNAATIIIGATASTGTYGLINDGTVTNTACGKLIVESGIVQNNASRTITNAGLVQIAGTLDNNGTFTNNGVLKYGSLTGSVTNSTNPSLIVNDTPTPIFTYGGTYDGIINGIFTDANATVSAGAFSAPNTFTPSGLPLGSQTLYAKITPAGSGCTYIVPFMYDNSTPAPTFTSHPGNVTVCSGSTSFTVTATDAASYQWQVKTGGGAFTNLSNSGVYANVTTPTLNISNVTGLNGNQYRCVATSVGGNTNSNAATLTVLAKPTVTLTALGQTFNEGNTPTLCDTDANSVNSLQLTVNNSCVAGSVLWRTQVGAGNWSDWSANAPSSQPSDNTAYRYQAACDVNCPSTYTTAIALTINYRASAPQNVSLVADATNVAAGEAKSICNIEGNTITFNATCAPGEIILYSVDGADYSTTIPSQIVDGNFHNYRLRCRKADNTPSCVETESAVMSLKITTIAAAPTASISPANGCGIPTTFSGNATCGSLTTIWYNAATNQALPTLPTQTPNETTSYYARCQTAVSVGETGCLSEKSNVVTFTLTPVNEAPTVTASEDVVCTGTVVTVSVNCPVGSTAFWNTGVTTNSFQVAFSNITQQTYWAKCMFTNGCQSAESSHKTITWKAFELTLINIGQSKSGIKPLNDKAAWASQFITADAGPTLDLSTEANPTLYYTENANKTGPRYWTIQVETCALGTDGSVTYDMLAAPEVGVKQSFNTHENNAPYFMYANREGFTELYAQNHPAYGFYQDNGSGGNVYDAGLPKGLYKLSIRYWDQKGQGSIYPSTRQPAGNILAYQEYWFRIQSKNGIGTGSARATAATDNAQRITDNAVFAQVMPNPVSNTLRLNIAQAQDQKVNISLMDASGRTLLQRAFVPQTNQHQEEFEVSELANGMYFLKVNADEKQTTLKVIKVE